MATREQIAAQAHNRRVHEATDRVLRDLDRSVERGLKKVVEFESRLERDPFKAINLRADSNGRFLADPVDIDTGAFTLHINILAANDGRLHHLEEFSPAEYKTAHARVQPIDLLVTPWATLLSVRIDNLEISRPLKLNMVKRASPSDSPVHLIDIRHNEYYYPKATNLRGAIIAGHPRIGVIIFEPFRRKTDSVSVYFSELKLSPVRGANDTFSFACCDAAMERDISESLESRSLAEQTREMATTKLAGEQQRIIRERDASLRPMPKTGCLIALLLFPLLLLMRS